MKKVFLGAALLTTALVIGLFTNASVVRATEEVPQEECVEVTAPDPETFERDVNKYGTTMATYKWFETEDGVWQLKLDVNPIGGKEGWVSSYPSWWGKGIFFWLEKPESLPQTVTEVTCPEPEEPTEEEPVATPSATVHHSSNHNPGPSMPSAPQCTSSRPSLGIANINVIRTSDTTALVQWSLHSGDQTHVIFGEQGTGWHHAALNVGISGEAVINSLVAGRIYDWQAIPMNGCAAGDRSPIVTDHLPLD